MHWRNNSVDEVLAHPGARKIVDYLWEQESVHVVPHYNMMKEALGMNHGVICYMLQVLERQGIIVSERKNFRRFIRLSKDYKADLAMLERKEAVPEVEPAPRPSRRRIPASSYWTEYETAQLE